MVQNNNNLVHHRLRQCWCKFNTFIRSIIYGIQVWLHQMSLKIHLGRLNVKHYKLLRIIIKDWYRQFPKEMLDTLGRTKPKNFSGYAFASTMIKIYHNNLPEWLVDMMMTTLYQTRRDSEFTRFYSNAKKRIGTQMVWKCLHRTWSMSLDVNGTNLEPRTSWEYTCNRNFYSHHTICTLDCLFTNIVW